MACRSASLTRDEGGRPEAAGEPPHIRDDFHVRHRVRRGNGVQPNLTGRLSLEGCPAGLGFILSDAGVRLPYREVAPGSAPPMLDRVRSTFRPDAPAPAKYVASAMPAASLALFPPRCHAAHVRWCWESCRMKGTSSAQTGTHLATARGARRFARRTAGPHQ
jgi:hypothetical protein